MTFLFDSSSIINLCAKKKVDVLLEGGTLSLAIFEVGNAIWKQVYLRKSLTLEEGEKVLETLNEVIRKMKKVSVDEASAILRISVQEKLTYYDASYIHVASKNGMTLVTDDEGLRSLAKKYVDTLASTEMVS